MRPHQADRRGELAAGLAPAEFRAGEVALVAVRRAEIFAGLGDAVKLVLRNILGQPVAAVIRKIELLGIRIPVEADRVADALGDHFRAATVKVHAPNLAVGVVMKNVIAWLSDWHIQLAVRTNRNELPAVGFIL